MTDVLLNTDTTDNDDTTINDILAKLNADNPATGALMREINFCNLSAYLKAAGVSSVECDFQGGGDSGDIQEAATHDAQGQPVDLGESDLSMPYIRTVRDYDTKARQWRVEIVRTETPLKNALEDFIETEISATSVDWYNNDGGDGHWNLNVDTNELDFEINVNIVESHCEYTESDVPLLDMVAENAKSAGLAQLISPALTLDDVRREADEAAKAAAHAQSIENAVIREAYSKAAKPAVKL